MNLASLIDAIQPTAIRGSAAPDTNVAALHYRSDEVVAGGVFFAIAGFAADGHDYIDDACRRGAVAIVAERPRTAGVPLLQVNCSRAALAQAAAAYYDHPSRALTLIGLTGTNGKTTVSYLLEAMLAQAGASVGVIGTVNYRHGPRNIPADRTTPESLDLQRILADMQRQGASHVVMEVASHGLDLHRVDACAFDVAAFTNLTQDHLDFHGDMARYWESKRSLFTRILPSGPKGPRSVAVVNREDPHGQALAEELSGRRPLVTFGRSPANSVWADVRRVALSGLEAVLHTPAGETPIASPLVGRHNLDNILAAAGCATALGLPLEAVRAGVAATRTVPGRLEAVADPEGRFIYVDYAHTPDALENVLKALDDLRRGRLVCVFGCGGDRDRRKRPLMGEIAGGLSDLVVLTSDNPRTEDPLAIIAETLEGVRRSAPKALAAGDSAGARLEKGHIVVPDRREAIHLAVQVARPGDTVLIAGKGHETYQIIGRSTIPFDDREEVRRALMSVEGPREKESA